MQVSRGAHLKLAFILWALVGVGLLIAGSVFLFGGRSMSALDGERPSPGIAEGVALVIALAVGFIKGNFVLTKIARKNMARIYQLPDASPFYRTFSLKSWILILAMILIGRVIRWAGAPSILIGAVYLAVGFALVLGSRAYLAGEHPAPFQKGASS